MTLAEELDKAVSVLRELCPWLEEAWIGRKGHSKAYLRVKCTKEQAIKVPKVVNGFEVKIDLL